MGSKILEMTKCSLLPCHFINFFADKEKQISIVFFVKMKTDNTVMSLFQ